MSEQLTPNESNDQAPHYKLFLDASAYHDALAQWVLNQVGKGEMSAGRLACVFDCVEFATKKREVSPAPTPARCAVCGWPLSPNKDGHCQPGDCSMRPLPTYAYDTERANREYSQVWGTRRRWENRPETKAESDIRELKAALRRMAQLAHLAKHAMLDGKTQGGLLDLSIKITKEVERAERLAGGEGSGY